MWAGIGTATNSPRRKLSSRLWLRSITHPWGAPAVTQDPIDQLEGNWKAVLPMFDTTAHHIDTFTFTPVDANTVQVGSKVIVLLSIINIL